MRLETKQFKIYTNWIFLLPTIQIDIDSPEYMRTNFAICFHFLVFHIRLLWMKESK